MILANFLILAGVVMLLCIMLNKLSDKLGIPMLLVFILVGMLFGSDGIFKIPFDNYGFAEQVCSAALIFIMFYGGFGTKWSSAKPIAVKAILLSSLGTIITALLVALFCRYVLKMAALESFLIGSVISSTDAASVFSILRSKKLNLKYNTASLLEVESGSNDPFSYMLTVMALSLLSGSVMSAGSFAVMIAKQIVFGVGFGFIMAFGAIWLLKKLKITAEGFGAIYIVAVAVLSYAVPTYIGGNGYLSVYITGIILGNTKMKNKKALVNFFDGLTGLMQMSLFFLLGLLATPSQLPRVALPALAIAVFMTFIARPAAVAAVLGPFRSGWRQQALVAFAGMRGAASIVFAIMAVMGHASDNVDIFHMVFFIVLFSILFQGTLIPAAAEKLNMTDSENDVMKTFTDYLDEVPVQFMRSVILPGHPWENSRVSDIVLPPGSLLVLIVRGNEKTVPNGSTVIEAGDTLILSGRATENTDGVSLYERTAKDGDIWTDRKISDIDLGGKLIIMIRRGDDVIIPNGESIVKDGDVLVINDAG